MTTEAHTQPLTVRAILFTGTADETINALASRLADSGVARAVAGNLPDLSAPAVAAVGQEIATVADALLDLNVLDLALSGWRKHSDLRSAAARTLDARGSEEIVELANHQITSIHRPRIDLYLDSTRLGSVQVEITVIFDIQALAAVIRDGCLVALRTGRVDVTAKLTVEDVAITERKSTLDLAPDIRLNAGVRLVDEGRVPPSRAAGGHLRPS
jgi:hypothetical protein